MPLADGGALQRFQGGNIYWSPATGAQEVHGAVLDKYISLGRDILGYPKTDTMTTWKGDGLFNAFEGGWIEWSPSSGAHEVHGAILTEFIKMGWESGVLGYPTSDETTTGKGDGRFNNFQGGLIEWSPASGAHEIHGPILDKFAKLGWEQSVLGYPTTDTWTTGKGDGLFNYFQGGLIEWSQASGAYEIHGPILDKFAKLGWEQSVLGYPTTDTSTTGKGDGLFNYFQGGLIEWSPASGAWEVHGSILNKFAKLGWEQSILGYPTTDTWTTGKGDGLFNYFQGGLIEWSPASGAWEIHGPILDKFANLGWEQSVLGYPTTDTWTTGKGDGLFNYFQGGLIEWSPSSGAHEIHGAILGEFAKLGWEKSSLGYPTSDETGTPDGFGRFNHFQGGTIYWHPWMGVYDLFLQDRALASVEESYAANGLVDRNTMLHVFGQVELQSQVSAADFADLQALVKVPFYAMPGYVHNLADKAVNGNTANDHYEGSNLGNLHVGSFWWDLACLVDKWFYGGDRPEFAKTGQMGTYQLASGTLFGNGIDGKADVDQGKVGDCYYIAALGETAYRTPNIINDMFIDNGDNTWTVRFFHDGAPDFVTVDKYFPAANGKFIFDNIHQKLNNASNKLWVALAEKAYAQLAEEGWSRSSSYNSYQSIDGGWSEDALKQITGFATSGHGLSSSTSDRDAVSNAFDNGKLVCLATKDSGVASNVLANHFYILISASAETDQFILINPWGPQGGAPWMLVLHWSDVAASFDHWSGTN
jgi:Uma2 family endonuclease